MKKIKLPWKGPREWEGEAVDFYAYGPLEDLSHAELLKFSIEAVCFIGKTMDYMELRPKRSMVKKAQRGT